MSEFNNPAIENILSRRSIRRFNSSMQVPQKMVELMVECACAAPSAGNFHPWHFIVIDKREKLDAIAEAHPYAKMLRTATLAVAVCSELEREGRPLRYWEEDCSAAMQNLLLAANALGLGSVWLGVKRGDNLLEEKLKTILDVPSDIALMSVAAVGYPLETKDPHKGVDSHSIHLNKW